MLYMLYTKYLPAENAFLINFLWCDLIHRQRTDLDEARCPRHEKSVQDIMSTIFQTANPFDVEKGELIYKFGKRRGPRQNCGWLTSKRRTAWWGAIFQIHREEFTMFWTIITTKLERNKLHTFSNNKKVIKTIKVILVIKRQRNQC